jgi:hypothetical protein
VDKRGLLRVAPKLFPPAGQYLSLYMFDMAGDFGCLVRIRRGDHDREYLHYFNADFKFGRFIQQIAKLLHSRCPS